MCGRYTLVVEQDDLEERFGARFPEAKASGSDADGGDDAAEPAFTPRYNAAPAQALPVLTNEEPDAFRRFEWGLVPSWADGDSGGLINARAESVAEKPSFREAYEQRRYSPEPTEGERDTPSAGRCLVPADGFYEWVETEGGKQPYRVTFEDDRIFAMAGLWERREPDATQTGLAAFGGGIDGAETESGPIETFTIVTTEPNEVVSDLHHRMAVILDPDDEQRWLSGDDPSDVLEPYPADEMRAYPVSTAVNDPSTDDPSLIESIEPA
ncbi:SOS response-associated peptidase [Natrinema salifodinae]|uniref:Putative SOS response-associated peptidase YedK n=1 Tax=Natrinema salifodinae TaxID=1202768 RepID=A0A1I0PET1_9EURY|nr:SOS response-associated peptidase [Natrinema salifodinae]SEW12676.1 Putative SOS response-associated peptidase YedK [Natrinema salifodinae]